jgi:hypothetical protein
VEEVVAMMVDPDVKLPAREEWRPWSAESLDWRWWAAEAAVAAAMIALSLIPLALIGFGLMETTLDTPFWGFLISGAVLAFAALGPALTGGVRRWWLLVPAGAMFAFTGINGLVQADLPAWLALGAMLVSMVAGTWAGRALQMRFGPAGSSRQRSPWTMVLVLAVMLVGVFVVFWIVGELALPR